VLLAFSAGLRDAMVEAFVGRTAIWGFGWQSFLDKPILGLGYGGWDAGFPAYATAHGLYRSFPPHNMLLGAWATTGIAGLVLTLAFFVLVFRVVARGLSGRIPIDQRFAAFAGAALAWVFVQGMGENTDVFGDIHMIPVVALLLVHLIRPTGPTAEESTGDDPQADRRDSAAPAVPPLRDVHPQSSDVTVVLPAVVRGEGPGPGRAGDRRG
jgi:hypothetical protein